jgi:peptidoglycan/LPS O-acetylase OafA/YrhL
MTSAASRRLSADGTAAYREDIDGLRALAILLVVIYHVWLGRVSGGVDVFLIISAFFLTSSFARRLRRGAPLHVGSFWLRKFRRLLPAAAVTLVGVLAVVWWIYPASTWPAIWRQTWASLFYVQNWELAFSNVDYYAREEILPSPLQHFWSLSVQGQVFVLWPVLFLVIAWVVRRTRLNPTLVLVVVFGGVFVASLVYSIVETANNQTFAYFDSFTRLWEFAAGSLLAVLLPFFRAPAGVRALLGWVGVAGVLTCGLVLDVQGGFPGYLALWPVLATACVVLAGATPTSWGPGRLLASAPLRFLGRDAYALYLVHWPVLITWFVVSGTSHVGASAGLAIIAISLALARVVASGVENPVRRIPRIDAKPLLAAFVVALAVAVVAGPLATWQTVERARVEAASAAFDSRHPGAAVLLPGAEDAPAGVPLWPSGSALGDEWVALDGDCVGRYRPTSPLLEGTCLEQRVTGPVRATVVVVGDSHAQQWAAAVLPLAAEQGWDVVALLKGGCAFAVGERPVPGVENCPQWRDAVMDYVDNLSPDLVFAMATKTVPESSGERALRGLRPTVERLAGSGADVVLFRDNPRFDDDMFVCVEREGKDSADCSRHRADVLALTNPASALSSAAEIVDLSEYLCPQLRCVAAIGNIAVYLDDNHLTASFAHSLSPMVGERLRAAGLLAR